MRWNESTSTALGDGAIIFVFFSEFFPANIFWLPCRVSTMFSYYNYGYPTRTKPTSGQKAHWHCQYFCTDIILGRWAWQTDFLAIMRARVDSRVRCNYYLSCKKSTWCNIYLATWTWRNALLEPRRARCFNKNVRRPRFVDRQANSWGAVVVYVTVWFLLRLIYQS